MELASWEIAVSLVLIVSALMAQSAPLPDSAAIDESNAAYEQLSAGQTEEAILRLEAALVENPGDPALLINLGTAYTRTGRIEDARDAFRAAVAAEDRYQLQLADGSWADSRKVARLALESVDRTALAAK